MSDGQPRPGWRKRRFIHSATSSRILGAGDGAPYNDDLRLDRQNRIDRLRPEAARQRDTEAPSMHRRDRVDMGDRTISGDPNVRRGMDADIGEARWKGGVRGQDLRLAGFGDRVDDDQAARASRRRGRPPDASRPRTMKGQSSAALRRRTPFRPPARPRPPSWCPRARARPGRVLARSRSRRDRSVSGAACRFQRCRRFPATGGGR